MFERNLNEVCSLHVYASFGTFFSIQIGPLLEVQGVFEFILENRQIAIFEGKRRMFQIFTDL